MIKNGKLFGKINVFDFCLIILLFLFVFGVFSRFVVMKNDASKTVRVTYNIEVKSVRKETVEGFEIGHKVYSKGTTDCLGEITKITTEDATDLFETKDGRYVDAPVENRVNLILSVETEGYVDSNGIVTVSKNKIFDGKNIFFDTMKNRCQGTFKNLTIEKN